LDRKGVRYVIGRKDSDDEVVLAEVRSRIFITSDAKQRHRKHEQFRIREKKMRHFSLPANLSAIGKAQLLADCKNKIWKKCRETEAPFSYAVDKRGQIELRMDKKGIVHGRKKEEDGEET
jgi:hypothetical protein